MRVLERLAGNEGEEAAAGQGIRLLILLCAWITRNQGLGYKDPCLGYKDPCLGYKDPCLGYKDPCLGYKDPCLGYKDPCLSYKVPFMSRTNAVSSSGPGAGT